MEYTKYIYDLYNMVPGWFYKCLLLIISIIAVVLLFIKDRIQRFRLFYGTLLAEYVIWLYSCTVIFRPFREDYGYNLTPLWSYINPFANNQNLLLEDFYNVLLFVPFGLLLALVFMPLRWCVVFLLNLLLSVSIEVLQFYYCRGFLEFDDVFHNVIGGMIGYSIWAGAIQMYRHYNC